MTVAERRRATTLAELQVKMDRLVSKAGFAVGLGFVPRPSDVIIASYAKCGTTWLQQMVHSLRTSGDLDFDDISRVVPWIETAADLGLDLDGPQRSEPRLQDGDARPGALRRRPDVLHAPRFVVAASSRYECVAARVRAHEARPRRSRSSRCRVHRFRGRRRTDRDRVPGVVARIDEGASRQVRRPHDA